MSGKMVKEKALPKRPVNNLEKGVFHMQIGIYMHKKIGFYVYIRL